MGFNQTGDISTLNGSSLKLVDKFAYLGSSVSSTETDINTRLAKTWTAIDSQSVIYKSDLTDKIKRSFFQAAVVSILLYGCTTWTLTKRMKKKLDVSYTRMLWAIMNKSWRQRPTKQQLYGHLPPIVKTIQIRRTRHAGHCWRSRNELISDVFPWTPSHGWAKGRDQLEPTYSSSVPIRDVTLKPCRKHWTINGVAREGQEYPCWLRDVMMMKWNIKLNRFYIIENPRSFEKVSIQWFLVYCKQQRIFCDVYVYINRFESLLIWSFFFKSLYVSFLMLESWNFQKSYLWYNEYFCFLSEPLSMLWICWFLN